MIITIDEIEQREKSNKIKSNGYNYFAKKDIPLEKGKVYEVEIENSDWKGKTVKWINKATLSNAVPVVPSPAVSSVLNKNDIERNIERIRSMAVAYSKDLVVADKIKIEDIFTYATKISEYIQDKVTF